MSELHKRIRKESLHSRIMSAEETIPLFRHGMDLGWSGFTPVGLAEKGTMKIVNWD